MSVTAAIKAILEGNAALVAAATGGIYDWNETGRLGINRTTVPGAFDSDGIIKPCILIKLRTSIPDAVLRDDPARYVSVNETYECWFYEDSGFATIQSMLQKTFALLHATQVSGTFIVLWQGDFPETRDDAMDANFQRSDYLARVKRSA